MADWELSQLAVRSAPVSGDYVPLLVTSDTTTPPAGPNGSDQRALISTVLAAPGLRGAATYYMPAPSGGNDTAAFQAARAALPTITVYATPPSGGSSATYHYGTIYLASGTYQVGAAGDIGNLGPFISVIGPGHNATTLAYYGSGDCLRAYNAILPSDDNFDTLSAWAGKFDGFTLDGTHMSAPGKLLHLGDSENFQLGSDLFIKNGVNGQVVPPVLSLGSTGSGTLSGFYAWRVTAVNSAGQESMNSNQVQATLGASSSQALSWPAVPNAASYNVYRSTSGGFGTANLITNTAATSYTDTGTTGASQLPPPVNVTGCTGLYFENTTSWTEACSGRAVILNCDNCVVFNVTGSAYAISNNSFEYNDLDFKCYCYANQQAVVLLNGAFYANGSLKVRANMAGTTLATPCNALLTISGATPGFQGSVVQYSHLDLQAESNLGGTPPYTIYLGNPYSGGNGVYYCQGVLNFLHTWTPSNWAAAIEDGPNFLFQGVISGDTNLHPNGGLAATATAGPFAFGPALPYYSGSTIYLQMQVGDVFGQFTLTQNSTIGFQQTMGGPQRKVVVLQQAAAGGPYTVTWPTSGSPTPASPNIIWAGGTAPVMSTGANAVDVYEIVTYDGATWYGRAIQASGALPLGSKLPAGTAAAAPLNFQSGTLQTSAAAGAAEYDGTALYFTAAASSRQVVDAEQFTCLSGSYTLANSTSAQKLFNVAANGALNVQAATSYFFEAEFDITGLSASAHTISFGFGGTATVTSIKYVADRLDSSTAFTTAQAWTKQTVTSAAATALTAAGVTTTGFAAQLRGIIRINAAGTLIPQVTQGTASAAAVVSANSWIRFTPVGSSTVTNVGNWS
jgi:hypothetical protein